MNITKQTKDLLIDKMNIIKTPGKDDLCLVGPVNLPVEQGDFSTVFQWYTWLQLDGTENDKETVLESLSEANLAFGQQSSVLVYGGFSEVGGCTSPYA